MHRVMGAAIKPTPIALCLEIANTLNKRALHSDETLSSLSQCGLAPSQMQATLLDAGGTPRTFLRFSEIDE